MNEILPKLLTIASKVSTPLSVTSIIIIVLCFLYNKILDLTIFKELSSTHTFFFISQLAYYIFFLAIAGLVLGIFSYLIVKMNKSEKDNY